MPLSLSSSKSAPRREGEGAPVSSKRKEVVGERPGLLVAPGDMAERIGSVRA